MATISRYQTASGTTLYRVRYRTPDNRQTDKRGFKTKRDAQDFAATIEVSKLRGEYVAPTLGKVTVGELGPAWLDRQRGHVKPASYRAYESAWQTHVAPRWAGVPIAAIRHSDLSGWVTDLADRRGAATVHMAYRVLAAILADAVRDRLLAASPASGVKLPKRPSARHVYLSAAQLDRLADESGRYQSLVLLLGTVGLRWGEAAALRVSDVDFLRRRVALHRNAVVVGGKVVVGTLKGGKSRTVALPGFVCDALAASCAGKGRDDLIWPNTSGSYLAPPGHGAWLELAVARCMAADPTFPRVTAHALRHTAASLAIHAGAHPKVVQRMLGHASAAMTLDVYADLFDADLDAVAETVGKMWAQRG
jgi:integrase